MNGDGVLDEHEFKQLVSVLNKRRAGQTNPEVGAP